jgi:hypothetical protein
MCLGFPKQRTLGTFRINTFSNSGGVVNHLYNSESPLRSAATTTDSSSLFLAEPAAAVRWSAAQCSSTACT